MSPNAVKLCNAGAALLAGLFAWFLLQLLQVAHFVTFGWLVAPTLLVTTALGLYLLLVAKSGAAACWAGVTGAVVAGANYFGAFVRDCDAVAAASSAAAFGVGAVAFFLWQERRAAEIYAAAGAPRKLVGLLSSDARAFVPGLVLGVLLSSTHAVAYRFGPWNAAGFALLAPSALLVAFAKGPAFEEAARTVTLAEGWALNLVACSLGLALAATTHTDLTGWSGGWPGWFMLGQVSKAAFVTGPTAALWAALCWLPLWREAPGLRQAGEALAAEEERAELSETMGEMKRRRHGE